MKASFADQLKGQTFNFAEYGYLPIREDVILFKEKDAWVPIIKLWEKLNYVRNHLRLINDYINKNKGETVDEWLRANGKTMSDLVRKEIGSHNNSTGGISAYFYNLQHFFDAEEEKYDASEGKAEIPESIRSANETMRRQRGEKRAARRKIRKEKLKDLKRDGKGFLLVDLGTPVSNVDAEIKKVADKVAGVPGIPTDMAEKINKSTKGIGIVIAGTVIFVGVVSLILANQKK
ncbi:MAG: hypothetical protein UV51_C0010G0032 [Candidatus Woesebacteria bacterium GW2011_GWC1_42_9]|nr:MAG: hypothetical protein UV51_C0010G0032 [Candidatus Woesebacteria bacterium GW2011_GWC1_42_9]